MRAGLNWVTTEPHNRFAVAFAAKVFGFALKANGITTEAVHWLRQAAMLGEPDATSGLIELLRYLVQNRNRVISRDRLLERVWGYERQIETRSVDVHVGRLRKKLRGAGDQIETVVGLGYRFVDGQTAQT